MKESYARRLVEHAVSLRPNQDLFIRGPEPTHDFALLVGDVAYQKGARSVHYHFPRPEELAQLISSGSFDHIRHYHEEVREFYADVTRRGAASLFLVHDFTPPAWSERVANSHPQNLDFFMQGMSNTHAFLDDAILHRRFSHTIAPVPTLSWAEIVFPESEDPLHDLWSVIDHASSNQNQGVKIERARILNSLLIREIHITGGGNDLKLGLSRYARWQSGSFETPQGQRFHPNYPCAEIFTTPDAQLTEGTLVASLPLRLFDGSLVEELKLSFSGGKVSSFSATSGEDLLGQWLEVDERASFLGEIGLVGSDAPLWGIDRFFHSPILDENTASHIALGNGLSCAISGSAYASDSFLDSIGCNQSKVHIDIPFGSPDVSVVATKSAQGEVVLLDGGVWRI